MVQPIPPPSTSPTFHYKPEIYDRHVLSIIHQIVGPFKTGYWYYSSRLAPWEITALIDLWSMASRPFITLGSQKASTSHKSTFCAHSSRKFTVFDGGKTGLYYFTIIFWISLPINQALIGEESVSAAVSIGDFLCFDREWSGLVRMLPVLSCC